MPVLSFAIFAAVAVVTVLFSLFIALILSRRKDSSFDLAYGHQLLRYTIEDNHSHDLNSNNRISEYDESDDFNMDQREREFSEPTYRAVEQDTYYSLSKRNFSVSGSRLIAVKPTNIIEPVLNRQIRLQFK
ncbi:MAG: hypothetical protein IPJ75_07415 [Ignavibacteriales bacterium]|nr:hypothetical protein [Ignavibacteriales bacterium]